MRVLFGLILVLIMFVWVPVVNAQSSEAQSAYRVGEYERALELGIAERTDDSLAFAARVVLAEGIGAEPIDMTETRLTAAQDLAEQALDLNPQHDEARLQKAIALSLRARAIGKRPAFRARLGRQARALGQAVAADTPDNAYAHGFLAVWHAEVIRRGGRIGAIVLGASIDDAQAHYARAAQLAPGDAALHWQWARALSAVNPIKYADDIDLALRRAEVATPVDNLSELLRARALRFREATEGKSADEIRQMAIALL